MCLITFAYKSHPDYPLILLANRDEFYQRPTQAMHYWSDHPDILAGRDLEQMGTWLGINKAGKFTAVTNYRDGKNPSLNRKSRGELTRNFLSSNQAVQPYLATLEGHKHDYGDFNLLLGDQSGLFYSSNRGGKTKRLTPGIYGMSNALLDTPWPKLIQVKKALQSAIDNSDLSEETLSGIMRNSEQAKETELPETGISLEWERLLSSCFIQADNYGTRAITLLLQQQNGDLTLIEKTFNREGPTGRCEFQLNLPIIGRDE